MGSPRIFLRELLFVSFQIVFCCITFKFRAFLWNFLILLLTGNMLVYILFCIMWKLPVGRKIHTHILYIHILIFWLSRSGCVLFLWLRCMALLISWRIFSGKNVVKLFRTSKTIVVWVCLFALVCVCACFLATKRCFYLLHTLKIKSPYRQTFKYANILAFH